MSTHEELPDDRTLKRVFPEAEQFFESGVAVDLITLLLHQEQLDVLQMRFGAVRALFGDYRERFRSNTPREGHWQSFHKFKRSDGEQRLWVMNDTSTPCLRAILNDEVRDEMGVSIRYTEFAVHAYGALFGMRSGTAKRPASASSWQNSDLGTCALLEHFRDGLSFSRGVQSSPPVLDGLRANLDPFEQLIVVSDISEGLGELERLMTGLKSGSCYEPGVTGSFR